MVHLFYSRSLNFVPLENSEGDRGSLVTDETDNGKDAMSFIAEIWGLDQYVEPFIMHGEILFQLELLDTLKI